MRPTRHDVIAKTLNAAATHDALSTRPVWLSISRLVLLTFSIGLACLSPGCATLTVPAFDPSGNRIFSSTPTQLTLPQLHGPTGNNLIPNPSFPTPPDPAACLDGPPPPANFQPMATLPPPSNAPGAERGRCGQILLTPSRVVAPVGGEVILIAGICGEDGYLVTEQPIEWMLSPDSYGQIIEVHDDRKGIRQHHKIWPKRDNAPAVEKLGIDFARGRTSLEEVRITKGSPRINDDLLLRKGQTWVSLSSPTEGTSRVTVLAPDSDIWDKRRQTATIYWVDASWQFPGPQIRRAGEPATLVTLVKRAEGFAPAENWIVKYRLLTPGFQFVGARPDAEGIDARVDSDARGIAQIVNPTNRPATAVVGIEVCRPMNADERMPELCLARGQTMVTWSAPLLDLRVTADNDITQVGQPVGYRLAVSNPGDLDADNVRVVLNLKNNSLQITDINPQPDEQSPLGAVWNLGLLPARQSFDAFISVVPTVESDNRIEFTATGSPDLTSTATLSLLATSPQVELLFQPAAGSEQVEIGGRAVFEVQVRNTGRQTLNNLNLTVDADPGLQHAEGGGSSVSRTIPYLQPGQSQQIGVAFIVRRAGELQAKLVAKVGSRTIDTRTSFVRGIEPTPRQPAMKVLLSRIEGGNQLRPGEQATLNGTIQNPGQTRLTNIRIVAEYDPDLVLAGASQGGNHNPSQREVVWNIPSLDPGQEVVLRIAFSSQNQNIRPAATRLTARSAEGINAQEVYVFNRPATGDSPILPDSPNPSGSPLFPDARPLPDRSNQDILPFQSSSSANNNDVLPNGLRDLPQSSSNPSNASSANRWQLQIQPIEQNVRAGQQSRFVISFSNPTPQPDRNVRLELTLPNGSRVISLNESDGTRIPLEYSSDGRLASLEPIRFLRANETIQRILVLQLDSPGTSSLAVRLTSDNDPIGTTTNARINTSGM